MKDFFGQKLEVGDVVAQAWTGYNALHMAMIYSIGKKSIVTYPIKPAGDYEIRKRSVRDPESVIKYVKEKYEN